MKTKQIMKLWLITLTMIAISLGSNISVYAESETVLEYPPPPPTGPGGTWPGNPSHWTPITSLTDGNNSGLSDQLDFVGNSAYPGAYIASSNGYLYFRVRVDYDSAISSYASSPFDDTVLVLIDRVGYNDTTNANNADYAIAWDTKGAVKVEHGLEFQIPEINGSIWESTKMTDVDGSIGQKILTGDNADINLTGNGYLQTTDLQSTDTFGNTVLIDFAIQWTYLTAHSTLDSSDQTWKIQFGSIEKATDHNYISGDVFGELTSKTWSNQIIMGSNPVESGGDVPEPASMVVCGIAAVGFILRRLSMKVRA